LFSLYKFTILDDKFQKTLDNYLKTLENKVFHSISLIKTKLQRFSQLFINKKLKSAFISLKNHPKKLQSHQNSYKDELISQIKVIDNCNKTHNLMIFFQKPSCSLIIRVQNSEIKPKVLKKPEIKNITSAKQFFEKNQKNVIFSFIKTLFFFIKKNRFFL